MADRTGNVYGRLTVIGRSHRTNRATFWTCQCECGALTVKRANNLESGDTTSCGCWRREQSHGRPPTHGLAKRGKVSLTYHAWKGAKRRCTDSGNQDYPNYGGRGIEFRFASVADLVADIGEKPDTLGLSLDRIDNNGHYEAGNVRWATWVEQANNRRRPRRKV